MSAVVFLVRHRTVDLVAMTAAHAVRDALGVGSDLVELRRDDAFVLEGDEVGAAQAWEPPCTAYAHWFNPNKHRFGLFAARPGVVAAVTQGTAFPDPWLSSLAATDRLDFDRAGRDGWRSWVSLPCQDGVQATTLAAWDLEDAVGDPPPGDWPTPASLVRLQLWTLALRAASREEAAAAAERVAITRSRTQGLLVHPHMEGWTFVAPPWSLSRESSPA